MRRLIVSLDGVARSTLPFDTLANNGARAWTELQPLIAVGLISIHVAIGLSKDVWFPENVALLALLILAGPPLAIRR